MITTKTNVKKLTTKQVEAEARRSQAIDSGRRDTAPLPKTISELRDDFACDTALMSSLDTRIRFSGHRVGALKDQYDASKQEAEERVKHFARREEAVFYYWAKAM